MKLTKEASKILDRKYMNAMPDAIYRREVEKALMNDELMTAQFKQSSLPIEEEVKELRKMVSDISIMILDPVNDYSEKVVNLLRYLKIDVTQPSSKEAKWHPETNSGTYADKVHHGEMKVKPSTPSPSVKEETASIDWEKEAEELYPTKPVIDFNKPIRAAHIKACQMHRNEGNGLDELIEWVEERKSIFGFTDIPYKKFIAKANEIKSSLNR